MRSALLRFLVLLFVAGLAGAQLTDLTFENRTGSTVYFLYASPSTIDSWGQDLLGSTVFPDGEVRRVRMVPAPSFDVRAIDSNGNEYIVWNWRPSPGETLLLEQEAYVGVESQTGEAIAWLNVVNQTNYTIEQIVATQANDGWEQGQSFLRGALLHDGEDMRIDFQIEGLDRLVFDVMAIDEDGDEYIKWDVNLEITPEIVFTLDDISF